MHLHFNVHENPVIFLQTSKNLFQIKNFEVRKKHFRNIGFVYIAHVKCQKDSFHSNRDIKR